VLRCGTGGNHRLTRPATKVLVPPKASLTPWPLPFIPRLPPETSQRSGPDDEGVHRVLCERQNEDPSQSRQPCRPSPRSNHRKRAGSTRAGCHHLLRTELDGARTWCRSLSQRLIAGLLADDFKAAHPVSLRPTRPGEPGIPCSERQCAAYANDSCGRPDPSSSSLVSKRRGD